MNYKLGQQVIYNLTEENIKIAGGNSQPQAPATIVAIWGNEYPDNPKDTTGLNLKVLTDAPNDLWITSAQIAHDNSKTFAGTFQLLD